MIWLRGFRRMKGRRYGRADVRVRRAAGYKSVCRLARCWMFPLKVKYHVSEFYMIDAVLKKNTMSDCLCVSILRCARRNDSQWVSVCGFWDTWTPVVEGQFGCRGHRTCDLCLYGLTTYWATGGPPGNQEEKTWRFTGEVQIYFMFQARRSTNEWVKAKARFIWCISAFFFLSIQSLLRVVFHRVKKVIPTQWSWPLNLTLIKSTNLSVQIL